MQSTCELYVCLLLCTIPISVPHVCGTTACTKPRRFAQARSSESGQKFIGEIAIGRSIFESVFGVEEGYDPRKDTEKRAVDYAKKAAYLLFEPEELIGHNVGGLNGQSKLCEEKVACIVSELNRNFREAMFAMVPSQKVAGVPHAIVTAINHYLRSARSNYGWFFLSFWCCGLSRPEVCMDIFFRNGLGQNPMPLLRYLCIEFATLFLMLGGHVQVFRLHVLFYI